MNIKKYSAETWKELGYPDFHIFKKVNANSDDMHIHDFVELVYVLGGEALETINGIDYELKRGDLLIMDYGCNHTVKVLNNFTYMNILVYPNIHETTRIFFQKSFLDLTEQVITALPQDKKHEKVTFLGKERIRIERLLEDLLQEQIEKRTLSDIMKESYMISLLVEVRRKQSENFDKRLESFDEILLYIDNNILEKISMEDFARKFFYNPTYFSRLFKRKTGESFKSYVYRKRMEKAANLLITSDHAIEEIINLLGYESRSSFFRNFYKIYGMTPTEYRLKHKTED